MGIGRVKRQRPHMSYTCQNKHRKVTIIKNVCERFRVPFYDQLGDVLRSLGYDLAVLYGQPEHQQAEMATVAPKYGESISNRYIPFGKAKLVWNNIPWRTLTRSDVIIVQQGNSNLLNHVLLPLQKVLRFKLAFWGHGRNFQGNENSRGEILKRTYSKWVDHWFAYNATSAAVLEGIGFPSERITVVNNTIDIRSEAALFDGIRVNARATVRAELGIPPAAPAAIYSGRLYAGKRIDFLLEAAASIHEQCPEFHLIVVGHGPEAKRVQLFTRSAAWVHSVGAQFGLDKIRYFAAADLQMIPGVVGLSVVDSFAFAAPLFTVDLPGHGPEMSYLTNGINGIMTNNTLHDYTDAIMRFLNDPAKQSQLRHGCLAARAEYTMEEMVSRFTSGVVQMIG